MIYSGIVFYLHLSANLFIHPPTHPSIHPSIHPVPRMNFTLVSSGSPLKVLAGKWQFHPLELRLRFRAGGVVNTWSRSHAISVRGMGKMGEGETYLEYHAPDPNWFVFLWILWGSNPLIHGITQLPGPPKKIGCASWHAEFQ